MRILIIVGSASIDSHSLNLAKAMHSQFIRNAHDAEIVDLVELDIPLFKRDAQPNEETERFLKKSEQADAYVWVTPIYHNSYSAILKNALGWQSSRKFNDKVVGLASNGGNRSPQAVDHLMIVARSQGLIVTPTRVCTHKTDYNEEKQIIDTSISERIETFCQELVHTTTKLQS